MCQTRRKSSFEVMSRYEALPAALQDFFDGQYQRAYQLVKDMRHPESGLYYDAYVAIGQSSLPSSIAATGVGLIALCIGDYNGWEQNAEAQVIHSLQAMVGDIPGIKPHKDPGTGFFAHFIDAENGAHRWDSEISTIDTALLVSGALFAMRYFQKNDEIARLAMQLYNSVDWGAAVSNPTTGDIYLEIRKGRGFNPLAPYNEYSILANMARGSQTGQQLWENIYAPDQLHLLPMQCVGAGRRIICETDNIPSSFVYQFPFYLVHEYTLSPIYQDLYANVAYADRMDWLQCHNAPTFVWGHGAGVTPAGHYHPDAIGNNPLSVASPYIIAGFLPVYPQGMYDLYDIYHTLIPYDKPHRAPRDPVDSIRFQSAYRYGLTRLQINARDSRPWYPQHTSVIDWSSMLYGLTAFKHGVEFFARCNQIQDLLSAS
ncbi:MAG: hypothetical protein GX316_02580 [Firmicutes bacterium]|nr:hypothetical protein [Bacillota bacterium]